MLSLALFAAIPAIPDEMPIAPLVGGRVTIDQSFGWPGVYFEGRFRGTDVTVEVDSPTEHLTLLVDGVPRATLTRPGDARLTVRDLPPGDHVVRLEKLTESQSGGGRFRGFFTRTGVSLAPQPRARQIEYVGDSFTVGYGNLSPDAKCTPEQVHDRTDTQQAFGPLLAKKLDADFRVIAYSGYGIVRNWNGTHPGESLPLLYPRTLPGVEGAAPRERGWHPQVIVVNLGTNDFSTPLHAAEAWADDAALRSAYRTRYLDFVRQLKARQPQARIVLMGASNFIAEVRQVAAATGATAIPFGGLALSGCNGHPSLQDHRALAALIEPEVVKGFAR
ncbi:GDSL-type esterase/lipase family protein [Sphingomonas sp. CJ20]